MAENNRTLWELYPKIKAEWEELVGSVEQLKALIGHSGHAVVTANLEGEIVSWNPAATALFGWDESDILSRPLTVLMPERYTERHLAGLRRYKETGTSQLMGQRLRLFGLHRDGVEIPLILTIFGYQTGAGRFISAMITRDDEARSLDHAQE